MLYGYLGTHGVLGYGLRSPYWLAYINPQTKQAIYSIQLSNNPEIYGNVTIGGTNSTYVDQTSVGFNSTGTNSSYAIESL